MGTIASDAAAVYRRCSFDRNDQASVSEQEELGLARCGTEGWRPVLYEDNDRSASRYARKDRDDWPRVLADLEAGKLGFVWLWETSRGDRKLYEWVGFLELCRERDVRIYVETHGRLYDMRNYRDMKTLAEDGVANAFASDETSVRVQRNLASAARNGRPHSRPPYGIRRLYDPVSGGYVTQAPDRDGDPPRCDVAAEIITRIGAADPLSVIRDDLGRRGIPGPTGAAWDRHTIRLIGLNPAYAGFRLPPSGDPDQKPDWEPVVDLPVHLAAAAVLKASGRPPRPGSQRHLLSYLASCGGCGGPLSARAGYGGILRYRCGPRDCVYVGAAWLDELVTLAVLGALAAPDAAEVFRADGREAAARRAEAETLRAQLDEWARASVSPHAYQVKEEQLLPRIKAAERAAARAAVPVPLQELIGAADMRAAWDTFSIPARRDVVRVLMDVSVARAADRTRAARTEPGRVIIGWKHG